MTTTTHTEDSPDETLFEHLRAALAKPGELQKLEGSIGLAMPVLARNAAVPEESPDIAAPAALAIRINGEAQDVVCHALRTFALPRTPGVGIALIQQGLDCLCDSDLKDLEIRTIARVAAEMYIREREGRHDAN